MSLSSQEQNQISEIIKLVNGINEGGNSDNINMVNQILSKLYIVSVCLLNMSLLQCQQDVMTEIKIKNSVALKIAKEMSQKNIINFIKFNLAQRASMSVIANDSSMSGKISAELYNVLEITLEKLYKINKSIEKNKK